MNKELYLKKIGQLLLVISILLLTNCNSSENKKEIILESANKEALTYRETINKPLIVDFGDSSIYEMVFINDSSLYWKSLRRGTIGDEKTITIVLDDYKVLTHWIEKDSTIVSILTDFENMTLNGFGTFTNHKSFSLIGILTVKE